MAPASENQKVEFSGITASLPAGSFEVQDLRDALPKGKAEVEGDKQQAEINEAIVKNAQPVEVREGETGKVEMVVPQIFAAPSDQITVPDGHELQEVTDLQGQERKMAVPIAGGDDDGDEESDLPEPLQRAAEARETGVYQSSGVDLENQAEAKGKSTRGSNKSK